MVESPEVPEPSPMTRRGFDFLRAIERPGKPRTQGVTYVRDVGLSTVSLSDVLEAAGDYMDVLKLGAYTPRIQSHDVLVKKVAMCHEADVEVGLGGVLLELALLQGPSAVYQLLDYVREIGLSHVEVSRSFAVLSVDDFTSVVRAVKEAGLLPIAEVGIAYGIEPDDDVDVDVARVITAMERCLEAGAWKVLLESEGITESRRPEDQRWDVVSAVANAIPLEHLMFEADDRLVWTRYIHDLGPQVNLFVDHSRVLRLEAARLGGWGQPTSLVHRVATFYPDHPEVRAAQSRAGASDDGQ